MSSKQENKGYHIQTKEGYSRLFVYGIFLGQRQRDSFGMENPQYATVPDFATFNGNRLIAA